MATATEIIDAAFEKLFKAPDETLPAEDSATGLRVLGRLLDSYDAYNVYFSSPSALTDTVDVEARYLDGLECLLAVRLTSSGYKIALDASTQQRALEFDNLVKAQLARRKAMTVPAGLLNRFR